MTKDINEDIESRKCSLRSHFVNLRESIYFPIQVVPKLIYIIQFGNILS